MARRAKVVGLSSDVLPLTVSVFVGGYAEYQAWCEKRWGVGLPPLAESGTAQSCTTIDKGTLKGLIWLPMFRQGNAFDAGALAHEALHVTWKLLDKLGVTDEETHCYLLQWIVTEATDGLA